MKLFDVRLAVSVGKKNPVKLDESFHIVAECAEDAICGARQSADTRFAPKKVSSVRLLAVYPEFDVDLVY